MIKETDIRFNRISVLLFIPLYKATVLYRDFKKVQISMAKISIIMSIRLI